MGLTKKPSVSCFDRKDIPVDDKNPDPNNWEIVEYAQRGLSLVVKIRYPNCTNYEGMKILFYRECTLGDLRKQKLIDPHFSNNEDYHSPFARFEPTERGWRTAVQLAELFMFGDHIERNI